MNASTGEGRRKPGRPRGGKRSDPDFVQITAYIRQDTHKAAKVALLEQDLDQDFSELLESLLRDWLGDI
jgi:hypothetical protein